MANKNLQYNKRSVYTFYAQLYTSSSMVQITNLNTSVPKSNNEVYRTL